MLQAKAETCAYTDIKSARWTLLRKDASLTGNARDALEAILEKHRDVAICHSMKEELSELFRIRGVAARDMPCRNGSDGSNRPGRAGYRPSSASRDARGSTSTGLPTTQGTASAPASSRGSTTGYRWRSGSATATVTTIASSPQSVPFPSQTSAPYSPRKREEPLFIEDISFGWRLYKYLSVPAGSSQCLPSR